MIIEWLAYAALTRLVTFYDIDIYSGYKRCDVFTSLGMIDSGFDLTL